MKKRDVGGVVTIKKYANRRLYNTETSSYITLEHLAAMTREGREFRVVDAKTDDDITHTVLTQIIMEEEDGVRNIVVTQIIMEEEGREGQAMLPVGFLRQLIALYGDSMQKMVPGYLEASMEGFRRNHAQLQSGFQSAVQGALAGSPFAEIAKRNMAMFEAATSAFKPGTGAPVSAASGANTTSAATATSAGKDEEIAALKAELASLHEKVERLAK